MKNLTLAAWRKECKAIGITFKKVTYSHGVHVTYDLPSIYNMKNEKDATAFEKCQELLALKEKFKNELLELKKETGIIGLL